MNDSHSYGTRTLREIVRIVFQHWVLMLLIVVVGAGGTYVACQHVTPTYRSKVSLMFKRPLNRSPISTDAGERPLEVFVKAQQQIVTSDLVMARAMAISESNELRRQWYELRSQWERARGGEGGSVGDVLQRIRRFLVDDASGPGGVASNVARILDERHEQFDDFLDSVSLETPGGEQVAMTETFTLTVERPGPRDVPDSHKQAMYAADMLADMYMVRYQELQQELNEPALKVTQDTIDEYSHLVERTLGAYETFVRENRADVGVLEQLLKSGSEHGVQAVLTRVRENDAELAIKLARDTAIQKAMEDMLPAEAFEPDGVASMSDAAVEAAVQSVPVDFLTNDPAFNQLVRDLARLGAKRAKLASQFTEASRDMQYLEEQVVACRRQLLGAIVAYARGLRANILARQQEKAMNEELVQRTTAERDEAHGKLAEYARLKNDFRVALDHLKVLHREQIDALANGLRAREAVVITKLDDASVPDIDEPVSPKPILYTVVAFLVSALIGVAIAFLGDHFDHTLRSTVEVERYLGVPVLGSVKRRGRSLVTT